MADVKARVQAAITAREVTVRGSPLPAKAPMPSPRPRAKASRLGIPTPALPESIRARVLGFRVYPKSSQITK